jgi:hypothetical protein
MPAGLQQSAVIAAVCRLLSMLVDSYRLCSENMLTQCATEGTASAHLHFLPALQVLDTCSCVQPVVHAGLPH